eukprot:179126_1
MIRITITDDIQIRAKASTTYDELIALVVKNIKHREKRIQQKKERAAARLRNVENEEAMNEDESEMKGDTEDTGSLVLNEDHLSFSYGRCMVYDQESLEVYVASIDVEEDLCVVRYSPKK